MLLLTKNAKYIIRLYENAPLYWIQGVVSTGMAYEMFLLSHLTKKN